MQQNSEQLMAGSMRMLWEEDGGGECGSEGYCGSSCVNSAGDGWRVQADKGHGGDDEGGAGVQARRLDEAFQSALSSNDLTLVVFTCELLTTTQVFNSVNYPLSQSVLMSLIQQLSEDLGEKTEDSWLADLG